jgi:imidazoleglycerol phosphate synthase glutamine amidotransferase subunit HisH
MPQDYFDDMWTTVIVKKTMWYGKTKNRRKDSSAYYVDSYVMPLDEDDEVI